MKIDRPLQRLLKALALSFSAGVLALGPALTSAEAARLLEELQWRYRPLFIFAPHPEAPPYRELQQAIERLRGAIEEREMALIEVFDNGVRWRQRRFQPEVAHELRQRFGVAAGEFQLLLVGKDGGVKARKSSGEALAELFALIDTMPMRRQEMRRQ